MTLRDEKSDTEAQGEDDYLYGFSTDEDSSDDERSPLAEEGVDVSKLPTVAKDDAAVKRKLEKAKRQPVCPILHYSYISQHFCGID